MQRQRILACLLLFLVCAFEAYAFLGTTAVLLSPQNGSYLNGSVNVSVSFSGAANVTIEYNGTGGYLLLNSTANQSGGYNFAWASANGSFPDGTYGLRVAVTNATNQSDNATVHASDLRIGNTPPEIVNVSINGETIASGTPGDSVAATYTNASRELTFNWTVMTSGALNQTTIEFTNATSSLRITSTSLPARATYNLTAGKNYVLLNATVNGTTFQDSVSINLTANVPLNLTALANQYRTGLVTSWNVTRDGTDALGPAIFVNDTFEILVNLTNGSAGIPFNAQLNYSPGTSGLAMRWNASADAFRSAMVGNTTSLSNLTRSSVTLAIESAGQTELFFDGRAYRASMALNFSLGGRRPYYQLGNASGHATYILDACASVPTGVMNATDACYADNGVATLLYLPRFERKDRVLVGEANADPPLVAILTPSSVSQGIIPLHAIAITPNPNATLCSYNLSLYNATTNTSTTNLTGAITSFARNGTGWNALANLTTTDGIYNLTVTCSDDQNQTNTTAKTVTVADTTAPRLLSVSTTGIGNDEATIVAATDEPANYTVRYGTVNTSLSGIAEQAIFSTSMSLEISPLSSDTKQYYTVEACDAKRQCNTSAILSFTTGVPTSGSSGGGGGGGGGAELTADQSTERTDSRLWTRLPAQSEISYAPSALALTHISLALEQASERVEITIKQYEDAPASLPSGAPGLVYRYLQITHIGLASARDIVVEFAVERNWLSESGISQANVVLYRRENGVWRTYAPEVLGSDGDAVTYRVEIPGFSWFAIAGEPTQAPAQAESGDVLPDEPAPPAQEQPSEIVQEGEDNGFVSALAEADRSRGVHPALIIAAIVVALGLATVGGLQYYKLVQRRAGEHDRQIAREREAYAGGKTAPKEQAVREESSVHDPMAPLHGYIVRMRAKGFDDARIRAHLVGAGWDADIVDMELLR